MISPYLLRHDWSLAIADDTFGLNKTPGGVRRVRNDILDERVRADLAKSACGNKAFDMRHKRTADAATAMARIDPDAFEKRHRLAFAAIGIFAYRDLCKGDGLAQFRLGDKSPVIVARENAIDIARVIALCRVGPQHHPHEEPRRAICLVHLTNGNRTKITGHDSTPLPTVGMKVGSPSRSCANR